MHCIFWPAKPLEETIFIRCGEKSWNFAAFWLAVGAGKGVGKAGNWRFWLAVERVGSGRAIATLPGAQSKRTKKLEFLAKYILIG